MSRRSDAILIKMIPIGNSKRGVTLIELILVIGLMAMMTILSFYEKQSDLEQARARIVGGLIFQYNNAVRSALAQNIPASSVTYTGSSWLKSSACAGMMTPGQEYLPCDFPLATAANPVPFGNLVFTTTVAVAGTPPNRTYTATTTTSAFTVGEPGGTMRVRADLSGLAALSAASAIGAGVQNVAGGVSPIAATSDARYTADPITAVMTFVNSNNAATDVWLRTDGSNSMHKSLKFDGAAVADRQILGASRVQNFAGQALLLGSGSGMTAVTGAGVVVDTGAEIMGGFRVRTNLQVDGDATVVGNTWVSGAVHVEGGIGAVGQITTSSSIGAVGQITSNASVSAGVGVIGQWFSDANDGSYYVDPNGVSQMNTIYAHFIADRDDPNYYVDPNVTSRMNAVMSNADYSGVFYDINNTGYYLQPSGANRLNGIWSNGIINYGSIEIGQYIQLDAAVSVGTGCAPSGLVSRDWQGALVSCQSGVWRGSQTRGVGSGFMTGVAGYTNAYTGGYSCPAGTQQVLISGIQVGGCNPCLTYSCAAP
jgi:type II secretory pathway pseudopilin PulG